LFSSWFLRKELEELRVVPYLVMWGIWLARNSSLFNEKYIPTLQVTTQAVSLLPFYKETIKKKTIRILGNLQVDKSYPWGFFMGLVKVKI
jgi:hypothetical protein